MTHPMRGVQVSKALETVASTRAMKAAGCRCNHCAHLWLMSPCQQLVQQQLLLLNKLIMQLPVSLLSVKVRMSSLVFCKLIACCLQNVVYAAAKRLPL